MVRPRTSVGLACGIADERFVVVELYARSDDIFHFLDTQFNLIGSFDEALVMIQLESRSDDIFQFLDTQFDLLCHRVFLIILIHLGFHSLSFANWFGLFEETVKAGRASGFTWRN